MAKALGAAIVDFYLNGWPEGYYSDESVFSVMEDGRIIREDGPANDPGLPTTDRYELADFGLIFSEKTNEVFDFSYFFNKWKKTKTTKSLVIEFAVPDEAEIRTALKGMRL